MAISPDRLRLDDVGATQVSLQIAGIGSRSYAFLIDFHIRLLLALAWLAALWLSSYLVKGRADALFDPADGSWLVYVVFAPPAAIYLLYHVVLEAAMGGRTPGKRAAGVRLVTSTGATPGVGALILRNVFRILDSLPAFYLVGLIATVVTRQHVRIGDLAAGTVLVIEEKVDRDAFALGHARPDADFRVAELADDILSRWAVLDRDVRRTLARDLLTAQGRLPADTGAAADLDQALRAGLAALRREHRDGP